MSFTVTFFIVLFDDTIYKSVGISSIQTFSLIVGINFMALQRHKFTIYEKTIDNLKFLPIMKQTRTYTYNAAVTTEYLKPLFSGNNYVIQNKQKFAIFVRQQDPLLPDEEYVFYNVESLFTNVPVHETIDYILHENFVKGKLPKICFKLVMKGLVLKLTTENTWILNSNFYKQIDGCATGGPISVIFSEIYMTKTEKRSCYTEWKWNKMIQVECYQCWFKQSSTNSEYFYWRDTSNSLIECWLSP